MNFRKFTLSSEKVVLAGKNAENNEELISQVGKSEDVFHTAKPGSPFVYIKKGGEKVSKKDIKESATFCAAKSHDWRDNKTDVNVHWFKGKDIYKEKNMKMGSFGVRKFKIIKVKKEEVERFLKEKNL
jgi:predicted ribosome quality control (RQC) complex YloA/Tae2 family protein